MRKIVLFLILSLQSLAWANHNTEQVFLLELDDKNVKGTITQFLPETEDQNIHLIGQIRTTKLKYSSEALTQIVWTSVEFQENQVILEKPLVSVFKANKLHANQYLPLDGDINEVKNAVAHLLSGDVKNDYKKKRKAENPKNKGRYVIVEKSKSKKQRFSEKSENSPVKKDLAEENQEPRQGQSGIQNLNTPVTSSRKSSISKNGQNASLPGLSMNDQGSHPTRSNPDRSRLGQMNANRNSSQGQQENNPEITYDVTESGCRPRVDRIHERVIIQNRSNKLENGVLKEEGACTDSLEIYPIMKDYLCEGCTDSVNIDERRAYSRYQEYWYDRENQRQNIGETVYVDQGRPYEFTDEVGGCKPDVDLQAGYAYPQVETVYYNYNNTRKVVQECHRASNINPIPITETSSRCKMSHDFVQNQSFEQKRSVFIIDGVEHEALACHPVGEAIQHELVETGCSPIVNLSNHNVTKMVRRAVRTSQGLKIITDECEPEQARSLDSTREGCEGDYFHDLISGRSYLKKRYFYSQGGVRQFVGNCLRTDEFLAHQTEINGFEHNDNNRTSRPKLAIYIESPDEGRITVDPAKVRGTVGEAAYTLLRTESRATRESYFEGCFRRIRAQSVQIYERPDGTQFEQIAGPADPIALNVDECTRSVERRRIQTGYGGGGFFQHGHKIHSTQRRTVTNYPDGTTEYGEWH